MVDFNSYVFSKAAASRILGETVVNTVPDDQYPKVWCWLTKGQKAIAVDKAEFKKHFAEYRCQQGQQLQNAMIDPSNDSLWYIGQHQVKVNLDHLSCTCHDYRTQEKVGIKTPTCKHAYAVLSQLGCNSLAEFIQKKQDDEASTSPQPTKVSGEAKSLQSNSNLPYPSQCSECPLAKHLERNRYQCTARIGLETVVKGHHTPGTDCIKPLEKALSKAG